MTSNPPLHYAALPSPSSSSGSTDDQREFDPQELTRLLRACIPKQEEMTARYEARAKENHDRLIELGGRPKRPVRLRPIWNATYKNGLIYISDTEDEPGCTLSNDMDPMKHHWSSESAQFQEELENWQRFRGYQQRLKHLDSLETELELENTDAGLIMALTRLSDWKEFEIFQDLTRVDALHFEDCCRQHLLRIVKWELTAEDPQASSAAHAAIGARLPQLDRSQEDVEAANKQLNWIKGQWPKMVAESVDSLSQTPELRQTLEAKFRKQTHAAFSVIQKLGGRPSHAVSPPDESMDVLRRILYWSSETSKFTEELLDWKTFLNWRRNNLGDKPTMGRQNYQCPQFQSAVDFLAEFEKFRLFQYNLALTWLKCWQRVVRWHEEEIETPDPKMRVSTLEAYAEVARSHIRDSEQKLAEAATRLEKAKQEHAYALCEHDQATGRENKIECPQKPFPPTPPLSDSGSPQSSPSSSFSPPSSQSSQSRSKKEDVRKKGAKTGNTNTEPKALSSFSSSPHQVKKDDDIQMTDAPEDSRPMEAVEEFEVSKSEDTVMTDFEDSPDHTSSNSSKPYPISVTTIDSKKLPSSSARDLTARKTRSTMKLEQALSGKIVRDTGKKPAKKARNFTEQQTMVLLNAASNNGSPTDSPPLRRSERLKEKAASSAVLLQSHLNTAQPSQSSDHKQSQQKVIHVEPSRPSRKRKPKKQPDALDPPQTRRQKKPKKQLDTLDPPQTTGQKKPKMQSKVVDLSLLSRRQKKLQKRAREAARPG